MSEIKHTPGPWSVSFEGVDPEWAIVATQGGRVVANVNADHLQDANARLIAAAPDLLEAAADLISLTRVVRLSVRLEYDQLKRIDRAKAAIAKAEGRQP